MSAARAEEVQLGRVVIATQLVELPRALCVEDGVSQLVGGVDFKPVHCWFERGGAAEGLNRYVFTLFLIRGEVEAATV